MKKFKFFVPFFLLFIVSCGEEEYLISPEIIKSSNRESSPPNQNCQFTNESVLIDITASPYNAIPDDGIDDSEAFARASEKINSNCGTDITINLYIPQGVYNVGIQLDENTDHFPDTNPIYFHNPLWLQSGINIINIENCENVNITGDGLDKTILRFNDGMYYGGFDSFQGNPMPVYQGNGGKEDVAFLGDMIRIINSTNICIQDIGLDGNLENMYVGGCYDLGVSFERNSYQILHSGVYLVQSSDINISNVRAELFGLDGFGLQNNLFAGQSANVKMSSVISTNNGRQGLSWTGGDGLEIRGGKFNNTGQIFLNFPPYPSQTNQFINNPGAGLDIEPEANGTCFNGYFYKCEFVNNQTHGIITDKPTSGLVKNIIFEGCYIDENNSFAIWGRNFGNSQFLNCNIHGSLVNIGGTSANALLVFNKCDFSDLSLNGNSLFGNYLMDFFSVGNASINSSNYFSFNNCKFNLNEKPLMNSSFQPNFTSVIHRGFNNNQFNFNSNNLLSAGLGTHCLGRRGVGQFYHFSFSNNQFIDLNPASFSVPTNQELFVRLSLSQNTSLGGNEILNCGGPNAFSHFTILTEAWDQTFPIMDNCIFSCATF